jgi:hypothetical protein
LLRAGVLTSVAVLSTAFAAGCGDDSDYKNIPRPPQPIVLSASINAGKVSVSPAQFGAGPVTLIVANETEKAQEITLETDEIAGKNPGIRQRTGPINPGDTASLKADLAQGTYKVAVAGDGIDAAALQVGKKRESAQNELLQP